MPALPKPDASGRELATYSRDLWRAYDPFYNWARQRWTRVLDFLRGQHWRVLSEVNIDRLPSWKRYPIIGMTLGIYNDLLAQWLESRVRWSAIPTSPDPEDVHRAELGEQVLRYLWELTEADRHKIDLGAWLLGCGCGTLMTTWDTNTGNLIPLAIPEEVEQEDPQTGQLVKVPTGNLIPVNPTTLQPDPSMPEPVMLDAGEIALEVLGPDMARWGRTRREGLIVGRLLSFEDAVDQYGTEVANKLKYTAHDQQLDLSWLTMPQLRPVEDQRALVLRHFQPRSFRFPGGMWWESNEDLLLTPPVNLPGGRVPGVPFRWIPTQGYHAFGMSPLYEVTFSNKAADIARAKQEEWMERVLPKLLLMSAGNVAEGEFNDRPGQEIPGVNPGAAPEWLNPPSFPEQLVRMAQDGEEDALFVSGYKFRRRDKPAPGTARGTPREPQERNEKSEIKLATLVSQPAWAEVGRVLLSFVGTYYTDERTIAVMGTDRSYQWVSFKGTDLANLAASIVVSETSLYPWTRQGLRDNVVAIMQTEAGSVFFRGADGQIDPDKIQLAAEALGVDVALSTLDVDVNEARNEITLLRAGQPVEYQDYQNSEAHLQEKFKVLKSVAFKGWPQEAQQALRENVDAHRQALQQQQESEEQKLLQQELALRTIRANVEAQGEVRSMLAEKLLEAVTNILGGPEQERPDG